MRWIEDHLGKEIADKIIKGEGRGVGVFNYLEGLDLEVGGGFQPAHDGCVAPIHRLYLLLPDHLLFFDPTLPRSRVVYELAPLEFNPLIFFRP